MLSPTLSNSYASSLILGPAPVYYHQSTSTIQFIFVWLIQDSKSITEEQACCFSPSLVEPCWGQPGLFGNHPARAVWSSHTRISGFASICQKCSTRNTCPPEVLVFPILQNGLLDVSSITTLLLWQFSKHLISWTGAIKKLILRIQGISGLTIFEWPGKLPPNTH